LYLQYLLFLLKLVNDPALWAAFCCNFIAYSSCYSTAFAILTVLTILMYYLQLVECFVTAVPKAAPTNYLHFTLGIFGFSIVASVVWTNSLFALAIRLNQNL
jgi:hypothetical protein